MFKNKKRVFLEALILTVIIFIFGMLVGSSFEKNKLDEIDQYYASSEVLFMDLFALNNMINSNTACNVLVDSDVGLADNIYGEAFLLEKYDGAGKVTNGLKLVHKKYDMLRTLLWMNTMDISKKCSNQFDTVVYLYQYDTKNLAEKATQKVWERVLFDLKQQKGNDIILIPIAVNNGLVSLDSLIKEFNIENYPVVIINEKYVVDKLDSVDDLEKYLN